MRSAKVFNLLIFLIFLIVLFSATSYAAGVREYVLPNGLKVLMTEDHTSPIAVFQIWYRVGSRDEISGRTGMSHLLEHMMFKGTEKYGPKVLSRTVGRYGGSDNAGTSRDYTYYHEILPSDRIGLPLEFESDRMRNLVLQEKETLSERSVVMEERRWRLEDDPQGSLFEEVIAEAFMVHPYRWPVLGWRPDLASITREDLAAYYRKYYSPDNAVIVVAGDIDSDELIGKIGDYFSPIGRGPERESFVSSEPQQRGERRVRLRREAELPHVVAAYHTPSFPDADSAALEVLATILSDGKSSRLYKTLVYEKKLALDASASYEGLYKDPFLFFLDATPAPGQDVSGLEEALYAEVERIKAEPPSEFELQKAKNQIEASFVMEQDSVFLQAQVLGMFEMLGGWRLKDAYLEGIRNVTAGDVQRVAAKYVRPENRTVGILVPERAE
jgi:zinc protease